MASVRRSRSSTLGLFWMLAALSSTLACGSLLGLGSDDDDPDPRDDASVSIDAQQPDAAGDVGIDGSVTDAVSELALSTCTTAGDCPVDSTGLETQCWVNRCVTKVIDVGAAARIEGVVVTTDELFVTVPGVDPATGSGAVYSRTLAGGNTIARVGGLYRVGALARGEAPTELYFAVGDSAGDAGAGVLRCTAGGLSCSVPTFRKETAQYTKYFAHPKSAGEVFFYAIEGASQILRAAPAQPSFYSTPSGRIGFMELGGDDDGTLVYANLDNGVHAINVGTVTDNFIANDVAGTIGIAVAGSWVYFDNIYGQVKRAPINGGTIEVLFAGPTKGPSHVGDVDLSPSGDAVYWAMDGAVYRLALK